MRFFGQGKCGVWLGLQRDRSSGGGEKSGMNARGWQRESRRCRMRRIGRYTKMGCGNANRLCKMRRIGKYEYGHYRSITIGCMNTIFTILFYGFQKEIAIGNSTFDNNLFVIDNI
jgi:hypothetical protein